MMRTTLFCFFASYACAFLCDLAQLKWRHALLRWISLLIGTAGLVAHTAYLLNRSNQSDLPPLLSSVHDWMLVLAFVVVLVYLFVALADSELTTGLVIWPIVLALVIASRFVPQSPSEQLPVSRGWGMLHASMLVLGTAGVLQGFVLSLLYLWQHRRLKHKQASAGGAVKLPSLERIERWNRWSILTAVPLLTIGVASGIGLAMISNEQNRVMTWSDPVVIGGAVTWTLMGILFVWLLTKKKSPGKQVALLTAWSCGFLLVTLVGLEMLVAAMGLPTVH